MSSPETSFDVMQQEWVVQPESAEVDPWFAVAYYVEERLGEDSPWTDRVVDAINHISQQDFYNPVAHDRHLWVSRKVAHVVTETIVHLDQDQTVPVAEIETLLDHAVRNSDYEMQYLQDHVGWFEDEVAESVPLLRRKPSWRLISTSLKKADPAIRPQILDWINKLSYPMFSPVPGTYFDYIGRVRNLVGSLLSDYRYRDQTQSGFSVGVENSVAYLLHQYGTMPAEHRMSPRSVDRELYPLIPRNS